MPEVRRLILAMTGPYEERGFRLGWSWTYMTIEEAVTAERYAELSSDLSVELAAMVHGQQPDETTEPLPAQPRLLLGRRGVGPGLVLAAGANHRIGQQHCPGARRKQQQVGLSPLLEASLDRAHRRGAPPISMNHILLWRDGGHRPAVEPFGGLRRHVDAAVAVRDAIVVVPVGAVEGDAAFGDV